MPISLDEAEEKFVGLMEERLTQVLCPKGNDALAKGAGRLMDVGRHLCVADNAKRVRPLFMFWLSHGLHDASVRMIDAAIAGELLHSASLLHDDVIDNASFRRGKPSANAHWSNSVAVLSGNYLIAIAFELLQNYDDILTKTAIQTIAHMTKAAMMEIEIRGRTDLSMAEWRQIASGKTGALFAWCGFAAAMCAKRPDLARDFHACGDHIGVAFQMADDLKDLTCTRGLKDRFNDIFNKEPSYPMIEAFKDVRIKQLFEEKWQASMTEEDAQHLGSVLLETSIVETTQAALKEEIASAMVHLEAIKATPSGAALEGWVSKLI